MSPLTHNSAWIVCLGAFLLGCTGCEAEAPSTAASSGNQADADPPSEQVESADTRYAAVLRQGEKIGYSIEKIEHLTHQGETFVRTTNTEKFQVRRAGEALETQVETVSLETEEGYLRQFVTKIDQAGAITRFQGKVSPDGRTLFLTTQNSATRQPVAEKLPWEPNRVGPYAVQRLFQVPPLEAGQQRSATTFLPTLNKVAEIRVEAIERETTTLLGGVTYELLKAKYIEQIEGQPPLESTVWVNQEGDIVKMASPIQDFERYRCPKAYALSENRAVEFDLAVDTVVPVRGTMPDRRQANSAAYRVRLDRSEPGQIFSSRTNQRLEPGADENTATLHVYRIRPEAPLPSNLLDSEQPQPEDSATSVLVQVDDPLVQRLAQQAAVASGDRWEQATALESFVHRLIEQKDFSRGFLSAADVAEQKVGDCTEHAVLLMALLRAHNIPARGALGLVYVDHGDQPGFAYHMWTEAWIDDRWVPLDATRGEAGIDVGYIKVTQASLSGAGAFAAFLPVSQVIGQLQIEVVE